mgnify:CR=1 FL=1
MQIIKIFPFLKSTQIPPSAGLAGLFCDQMLVVAEK